MRLIEGSLTSRLSVFNYRSISALSSMIRFCDNYKSLGLQTDVAIL